MILNNILYVENACRDGYSARNRCARSDVYLWLNDVIKFLWNNKKQTQLNCCYRKYSIVFWMYYPVHSRLARFINNQHMNCVVWMKTENICSIFQTDSAQSRALCIINTTFDGFNESYVQHTTVIQAIDLHSHKLPWKTFLSLMFTEFLYICSILKCFQDIPNVFY